MDTQVLWFRVIPAAVCILIILAAFVLWAPFVPGAVRRRDWKMLAVLACSYLLFAGVLVVAIDTFIHPPVR